MKNVWISLLGLLAVSTAHAQSRVNFFQLSTHDAEAAVARALEAHGVAGQVSAMMVGNKTEALYDYHKPLSVDVKTLTYDDKSGRWSANLYFMAEGEVVSAIPAAGHYEELVTLPVLKRGMRNGEVITASDFDWRQFSARSARQNVIADPDLMIGKTARRSISQLRPVRLDELAEPAILKKNTMVKMICRTPGMEIATTGEALTSGAKGEVISVRNLNSKQVVRAMVESENVVMVSPSQISPTGTIQQVAHAIE